MICVLALLVFSVLGIFSLSYRSLAVEAFDCVFRKITLRKCDSALDVRIKSQIVGKLLKLNRTFAKLVYRYFEIFSWTLVILMFVSAGYSSYSVYNFVVYGNCYGPEPDTGFCPLDVLAGEQYSECGDEIVSIKLNSLQKPELLESDNFLGPENAKVTVIQFGCYTCDFTREAHQVFERAIDEYKDRVKFVYIDFPIEKHEGAFIAANSAECVKQQDETRFWDMYHRLFEIEDFSVSTLKNVVNGLSLDSEEFEHCIFTDTIHDKVKNDFNRGIESGVKGTPTYFINDKPYVGNIKYATLQYMIEQELNK